MCCAKDERKENRLYWAFCDVWVSLFAFFLDFSLQHNLKIEDGEDLRHEFERLKQAMEMVGFLSATKKQ